MTNTERKQSNYKILPMENVYVVTLDVKIVDDGRLAMRLVLAQFLESSECISETLCDSNN